MLNAVIVVSSAKCKELTISLPFSGKASKIMRSSIIGMTLNMIGDEHAPCLIPFLLIKLPMTYPPTARSDRGSQFSMCHKLISSSPIPTWRMISLASDLITESYAFFMSRLTMYTFFFFAIWMSVIHLSMNACVYVDEPCRKADYLLDIWGSKISLILLFRTLSMVLYQLVSNAIGRTPRGSCSFVMAPFGMRMTFATHNSSGKPPFSLLFINSFNPSSSALHICLGDAIMNSVISGARFALVFCICSIMSAVVSLKLHVPGASSGISDQQMFLHASKNSESLIPHAKLVPFN